jgi:NADH-quinone oxidoreductase subunit L
VILACHHEQDMRKMGGLQKYTPITRWTYLAACWAIAGFPWASGFYSKDEILWKAWTAENLSAPFLGHAIYIVGAIAALGTSFYMFRSYYMTFTGEYRGGEGHDDHGHGAHDEHGHGGEPHESPNSMTWVLIALAFGAVVAGFIFGPPKSWFSGHEPALERWLAPSLPGAVHVKFADPGHSTEYLFQFFGLAIAAVGWFAARVLYLDNRSTVPARLKEMFPRAWSVVYNKYYVDELYDLTVVRGSLLLARIAYWIDQNLIDGLVNFMGALGRSVAYLDASFDKYVVDGAVNGLGALTWNSGKQLRRIQTGHIQSYLFGALGGGIAIVILFYVEPDIADKIGQLLGLR